MSESHSDLEGVQQHGSGGDRGRILQLHEARWLRKVISACLCLAGLGCQAGWGAHPLDTDDPDTVPPGRLELQLVVEFQGGGGVQAAATGITLGITPYLDVGIGSCHLWDDVDLGFADPELAVKWNIPRPDGSNRSLALSGGYVLTGHADGRETCLTLISEHRMQRATLLLNVGRTWTGEDGTPDQFGWGLALLKPVSDRLTLATEITGQNQIAGSGSARHFLAGLMYESRTSLVYSAGVRYNPDEPSARWQFTTGITWEF